jgi:TrmH family RNA methyltransferase
MAGVEEMAGLDVPVSVVSSKDFDRVSSVKTAQGILAVVRTGWVPVDVLGRLGRIIALDGVQDPGNVGTILRTAAWMGIDGVLSGSGTADIYSPKVLRASMGGVWDVRVARCESLRDVLEEFAAAGHHLAAADFGGTDVRNWNPVTPGVLILGNEGIGVSREVMSLGPEVVTVAAGSDAAATESLNVAVASAIIMYRWCRF